MNASEVKRDYDMTDGELALFAGILASNMTRDAAQFALWGVVAADITALIAKENAFESYVTDDELRGEVTEAVEEKNIARQQLETAIRLVTNRAEIKWGINSGKYNQFGAKGLSKQSEAELNLTGRKVNRVGMKFLTELEDEGLTEAMLDDVLAKVEAYETKIILVAEKEALRDVTTNGRILLGNGLYHVVVKYCSIGKNIWLETNEAKYNDYVIYKSAIDLPSKVQNLNYDAQNTKMKWNTATGAVIYQLEMKQNLPEFAWQSIYEGEDNEFIYTPLAGNWLFRCRGINTKGSGTWSDELNVVQPT